MNKIFLHCICLLITHISFAQTPANDDCINAVLLTPSTNSACKSTTAGTTVGATASVIPDCNAELSKDVWYKFVATQTYHKIVVRDASPSYLISLQFFTSSDGSCSNLVSKGCTINNDSGDSTTYKAYNLTIGETYFVKVFMDITSILTTTFNICVTSPPNITKPVNDSCQNATILIPSSNANILAETNGTCVGATPGVIDCYSRQSDDVWYKFKAMAVNHKVIVKGQGFLDHKGIFEYRWDECNMYPNNGICVNFYSADSMVYSMKNLTIGQYYYFRVTTDADAANREFTISVTTPVLPPNDECVDAQILVPHPDWTPTTGTTKEATRGDDFNVDCNYSYTYDVWYKFTATKSSHQIRVKGADFVQTQGKIQLFTGDCNNLVSVGCTDTYEGDSIAYNAVGLNPGETYIFKVYSGADIYGAPFEVGILSNNDDCESADWLSVNTNYRCLNITKGSTINATASSQAACTGAPDDDKWYKFIATGTELNIMLTPSAKNGIDNAVMEIFSGNCTNLQSIYCVNNTTGVNAEEQLRTDLIIGNTYYVRVYSFNYGGKGEFELCITSPIPSNDECINAIQMIPADIGCTNTTFGSLKGATASGQQACEGAANDDVWYKFTAVATKHLITVTPSAENGISGAVVEFLSGNCSSLNNLGCSKEYGSGIAKYAANGLTVGDTYYIRVHSFEYNYGNRDFTICVTTDNDVCEGAQTLIVNPDNNCTNVASGSTYYVGNQTEIPGCSGYPDDNLWYKFVATATTHRVKITPSAINGIIYPVLQTFDGACGNLTSTSCSYNNYPAEAPVEKSMTNLVIGNTYFLRVYSYRNAEGNGNFDICVTTPSLTNDECIGAVTIPVTASTTCTSLINGTTLNATQSMPACSQTTTSYADDDVWYKFTAIGNITYLAVTPTGTNPLFDPVMQLFETDNCALIGSVGSGCYDNFPGTGAFNFRETTNPGATYYLRLYSAANGTGQGDFTICAYSDNPPNDDCSGAIDVPVNNDITCTLTTTGTTVNATSSNAPNGCTSQPGGTADDDVWYKFTATAASQTITITPTAVGGIDNVVLRIFEGNCNNFTRNDCINNTTGAGAETYTAKNLIIGQIYYFSVFSYINNGTGTGAFTICINKPVLMVNDECTGAISIPINDDATCTNTIQGSTVGSTGSFPSVGCYSSPYDVWYKFVANKNACQISITPDALGGIVNPVWNLYSGNCNNLVSVGCASQLFTFENLTPGNTYYIRIGSKNGNLSSNGGFSICIKSISLPNDICTGAVNVPISNSIKCVTSITGTTVGATITQQTDQKDVWFKFTATETAHKINVSPTADSLRNVAFEVYSGSCGTLISLGMVSSGNDSIKPGIQSFENLIVGNTYYIRVFSDGLVWNGKYVISEGSFTICVSLSGNDICSFARNIIVNAGTDCNEITIDSTNNSTFSLNLNSSNNCNTYNGVNDSWFKFTALDTAQLITILGYSFDYFGAQLFSGNCNALTSMACLPSGYVRQVIGGLTIGQTYYLRVYTSEKSAGAKFSICISKTAFNDECIHASDLAVNTKPGCTVINNCSLRSATVSSESSCNLFYQNNLSGPPTLKAGYDVWYKFTATSSQHKITLTGITPVLDIFFTVYSGTCNSLSQIVCVNDFYASGGTDEEATALDNLTPGNTYYIRVYTGNDMSITGDFTLCVSNVDPLNDLCSNAIVVPVNSGNNCTQTITGNNINATRSYDAPYIYSYYIQCPLKGNADVFYKFVAVSTSQKITITPTSTGGIDDVVFEVYSGTCGSLSLIGRTDATAFKKEEVLRLDNLTSGNTYTIRVFNASGNKADRGSFTICINEPPLNDICSNATTLAVNTNANCSLQTTGTTVGATPPNGVEDVWYKFVATTTEHKITVTSITIPNPVFTLYKGDCNNLIQVREEINYDAGGTGIEFQAYDSLVIGNTYYIRVHSVYPEYPECPKYVNYNVTGTFTICVSAPSQPNDLIDNAITVSVNSGTTCTSSITGDNTGSTYSFNRNDCYNRTNQLLRSGQFYLSDLWYKFTATATSHIITVTPAATGGMRNPAFAVYERPAANNGDNLLQKGCINLSDNDNEAESQSINGLLPGKLYYIRVMSDIHTVFQGEFTLCITTPVLPIYTEKIITYAGGGSGEGVSSENSKLYRPTDVAVDNHGNVYIADSARIKRVNLSDGVVTVIAGTGVPGFSGDDGAAINAKISSKLKIAVDNDGNIFIADYEAFNNTDNALVSRYGRVRRIASGTGIISTIISMPTDISGYTIIGNYPIYQSRSITGITADATGNIYITVNKISSISFNIYKQTPVGVFTELRSGYHYAYGLSIDGAGNLYFVTGEGVSPCYITANYGYGECFDGTPAPHDTRYIRKLLPDGTSQIIAGLQPGVAIIGQGPFGYTGDGGLATNAELKPTDVKSDAAGNLYVTDGNGYWNGVEYGNYAIRKINTVGIISTISGTGVSSYSGDRGAAQQAGMHTPLSIALDSAGNVYFADIVENNGLAANRIRKILAECNNGIAMKNRGNTFYIKAPFTIYKDCDTIARISPLAPSPFNEDVTGKVWIEKSVPLINRQPYVQRHYEITPLTNHANSSARITLYFTQAEFNAYNAMIISGPKLPNSANDATGISNLRVMKREGVSSDGTGLQETYSGETISIDPADNDIIWNNSQTRWEVSFDVTSFSGFFVQTSGAVLPLTLLNFSGQKQNMQVLLNWQTTNEINTSYFIVQHSTNGTSFTNTLRVEAGNTSGSNDYSFIDANPVDGANFYRLQMIDQDGKITYSSIEKVLFGNKNELMVFPNPAQKTFTVSGLQGKGIIKIITVDGRLVKQLTVKGSSMMIDISNLSNGMYILQYNDGKNVQQLKVVKE